MRTIHTKEITEAVKNLCIEANIYLGNDIKNAICTAREQERSETAKVF